MKIRKRKHRFHLCPVCEGTCKCVRIRMGDNGKIVETPGRCFYCSGVGFVVAIPDQPEELQ